MSATVASPAKPVTLRRARKRLSRRSQVGIAMVTLVLLIALLGPFFAPYSPDATMGSAFTGPGSGHVLGLDYLGRDVLSRFLWGGRTAIILAVLITMLAYGLGLTVGLVAAYRRGIVDTILMRCVEVLLAFPAIILILLLVTGFGTSLLLLVLAAGVTSAPRTARIVRAAALPVVELPFVQAAQTRGESWLFIVGREILPNIRATILVDLGIRFTYSILIVAAASFLGLGLQPPTADWGLMVSENRSGITIQPWAVVAPIAALAVLTVGVNLIIDGFRGARLDER